MDSNPGLCIHFKKERVLISFRMCQGPTLGTGQEHGGEERALFSEILYSSKGDNKPSRKQKYILGIK